MGDTAPFSSLQCSRGSYVGEYIATLKEQTDFLKNEVFFFFLRKDLSEKTELIKSYFRIILTQRSIYRGK